MKAHSFAKIVAGFLLAGSGVLVLTACGSNGSDASISAAELTGVTNALTHGFALTDGINSVLYPVQVSCEATSVVHVAADSPDITADLTCTVQGVTASQYLTAQTTMGESDTQVKASIPASEYKTETFAVNVSTSSLDTENPYFNSVQFVS